jgi:hypothetical protein
MERINAFAIVQEILRAAKDQSDGVVVDFPKYLEETKNADVFAIESRSAYNSCPSAIRAAFLLERAMDELYDRAKLAANIEILSELSLKYPELENNAEKNEETMETTKTSETSDINSSHLSIFDTPHVRITTDMFL